MAGYADSIVVEVNGLAGRLGEIFLDPGHATAWDLASQVHSKFPLPCGMFWKLALEDVLVAEKCFPIHGNSTVTCVKHVLAMHQQMVVVSQVEQLLQAGRSMDDLPLESHMIWLDAVGR